MTNLEYNFHENTYTEAQIAAMFGADSLKKLLNEHCGLNGGKWESSINVTAKVKESHVEAEYEETKILLIAVYKTPTDEEFQDADGDWAFISWTVDSYRLS